MWIHKQLTAKRWDKEPSTIFQEKLDGWRLTFYKQEDGSVIAFGKDHRVHLEYTKRYPRIVKEDWFLKMTDLPTKTSIDGEIHCPGQAYDVSTALKEPELDLSFTAFAVPFWGGECLYDIPIEEAEKLIPEWNFAKYLPYEGQTKKELLDFAKVNSLEGWVLKDANYKNWYKVKIENTADVVITGILHGKGKYARQIGSLECSLWDNGELKPIANVSGMSNKEREHMTDLYDNNSLMGLVVEIKYQNLSKSRLRHPRFKRWRPDKLAEQCTWETIK